MNKRIKFPLKTSLFCVNFSKASLLDNKLKKLTISIILLIYVFIIKLFYILLFRNHMFPYLYK